MNLMVKFTSLRWMALVLIAGCSSEPGNWTELAAHPAAKGIKTYNLKQDRARQTSYEIEAEYPDPAVVDFYTGQVSEPWIPCFSEVEWQRLVNDDSEIKVITVHQVRLHWVNYEQDRLLLLGIWYESKGKQAVDVPDNSEQKVDLVEYQQTNVSEAITRLGLLCEGGR